MSLRAFSEISPSGPPGGAASRIALRAASDTLMSRISPVGFILKVNSTPTRDLSILLSASKPDWISLVLAVSKSNGMNGGASTRMRMRSMRCVISASPAGPTPTTFQLISSVSVRVDLRSVSEDFMLMVNFCSIENRSVSPGLNFQRRTSAASARGAGPPSTHAATSIGKIAGKNEKAGPGILSDPPFDRIRHHPV